MKLSKIVISAIMLSLLAACTFPHTDLKSPCAGAPGSPCDHRPVNDWWMGSASGSTAG